MAVKALNALTAEVTTTTWWGDPLWDAPIFNQYLRRWEVLTF